MPESREEQKIARGQLAPLGRRKKSVNPAFQVFGGLLKELVSFSPDLELSGNQDTLDA